MPQPKLPRVISAPGVQLLRFDKRNAVRVAARDVAYTIAPQRTHDVRSAGLLYRRAQPKLTKLLREIWMDTKHTLMLNANTEQAATQLLWLSTSCSFFLYLGSRIFQRGFCCVCRT